MDIGEVKQRKADLEVTIVRLLETFEVETGTFVNTVQHDITWLKNLTDTGTRLRHLNVIVEVPDA